MHICIPLVCMVPVVEKKASDPLEVGVRDGVSPGEF